MPKARVRRISVEEQGQRAARSTDVYASGAGVPEPALCKGCGSVMMKKRWYMAAEAAQLLPEGEVRTVTLCPACRRMEDDLPEGYLTLSGDYLLQHEEEILNRIRNVEARARGKNPLARIMSIEQEGKEITIKTTDEKLAQQLGRDIFKAHKGEIHYSWGGNENFLRVQWSREG